MGGKKRTGYWGTNPKNYYSKPQKLELVALDCEFVGCGPDGTDNKLARVTALDQDGDVLMDYFVKPKDPVTDYRTHVSGITAALLEEKAELCFTQVKYRIIKLLKNRILVGHGLQNDLEVLSIHHPWHLVRDSAWYRPYMKLLPMTHSMIVGSQGRPKNPYGGIVGGPKQIPKRIVNDASTEQSFMWCPRSLKDLAKQFLQRDIQTGSHSSQEDALAALHLYKLDGPKWDATVAEELAGHKASKQWKKTVARERIRQQYPNYSLQQGPMMHQQQYQYQLPTPLEVGYGGYQHYYPQQAPSSPFETNQDRHQHYYPLQQPQQHQPYQHLQYPPHHHQVEQASNSEKWATHYAMKQHFAQMRLENRKEEEKIKQAAAAAEQQLQQQWPTPQQSSPLRSHSNDNPARIVSP